MNGFIDGSLDAAGLVTSIVGFVAAALAAAHPTSVEVRLFRTFNRLPSRACLAIWVPMQYGTFAVVPAWATTAFMSGRRKLAFTVAVGGTSAWLLVKMAKPLRARRRPRACSKG
jgi:hypothetical protein